MARFFVKGQPPVKHKEGCSCFRCTHIPWNKGITKWTDKDSYIIDEKTGCWNAVQVSSNGYGLLWNGKKEVLLHRYMYEKIKGKIPEGLHLDHLCRNPRCANPDHVEPVTSKVNIRRGLVARLTEKDVAEIRRIYKKIKITQSDLGKIYNVRQDWISRIVNNRGWI